VRVEPLGLDRRRNRYWWLPPGEGEPRAGTGRVFVEGADGGAFRLLAKARARPAPGHAARRAAWPRIVQCVPGLPRVRARCGVRETARRRRARLGARRACRQSSWRSMGSGLQCLLHWD